MTRRKKPRALESGSPAWTEHIKRAASGLEDEARAIEALGGGEAARLLRLMALVEADTLRRAASLVRSHVEPAELSASLGVSETSSVVPF